MLLARGALRRIGRQEHLADREPPAGAAARSPSRAASRAEEPIGQLDQDAGAVAGLGIRAARRAMRQPAQDLEPVVDDAARTRRP